MHPFLAAYFEMQVLTDKTNVLLVLSRDKKVLSALSHRSLDFFFEVNLLSFDKHKALVAI